MIKYCKINKCRFSSYHVTSFHQCGTCKQLGHGMIECGDQIKITYLTQFQHDQLPDSEHCLFGECINPGTHVTESHTCTKCYDRLHSPLTCPTNPIHKKENNITCPVCRKVNRITFNTFGSDNKCVICFEQAQIFLPVCGHECLCNECSKKIDENKSQNDYYDEKYLIDRKYDIPLIKSHFKDYPSYVIVYEGMGCCTIIRRLNNTSDIEGLFIHSDDGYDPVKSRINNEFIEGYCKIQLDLVHDM